VNFQTQNGKASGAHGPVDSLRKSLSTSASFVQREQIIYQMSPLDYRLAEKLSSKSAYLASVRPSSKPSTTHTNTHKVLSDYNLCRCVYSQTCSEQLSTGSALTNPALWRLFSKCMVKSCTPGRPGQARTPNCSSLCSEYLNAESVINFRPNVLSIELLADVLRTENPYFSGTGLVPPPSSFSLSSPFR
jgi:hypothetical protein